MRQTITAYQIGLLLAQRHAQDVFVSECKNGPTWDGPYRRLDAWAMRKSWSPWTTIGYEIKVSRQDFVADQKWPSYLPLCHELYFVCPAGLIKAVDLPQGIGLIWVSVNGERLYIKIRATRREPELEKMVKLMAYVLMSRTRVVADMQEANGAVEPREDRERRRLDLIRQNVDEAEKRQALSVYVNKHIRRQFDAMDGRLREMSEAVRTKRC